MEILGKPLTPGRLIPTNNPSVSTSNNIQVPLSSNLFGKESLKIKIKVVLSYDVRALFTESSIMFSQKCSSVDPLPQSDFFFPSVTVYKFGL